MVVLKKASDYTYKGTTFKKGVPVEVSADAESYLLGTGYFEKSAPAKAAPAAKAEPVSKPAAKKPAQKVAVKTEDNTEE